MMAKHSQTTSKAAGVVLLVVGCALFFANSRSYSYDTCGNMTNRNGTALLYDEENQLKQYGSITFGYADGGARLWKSNGSTLTVWIGGIYEVRGSQTLCHVYAGGQRVATFEPITPACALLYHDPFIAPVYDFLCAATTWPLQDGRAPLTATLIPLLGVLCASVVSRRLRRS